MVPGTQVRVLAGLPSTSNRRKVQKHQCDAVAMQLRLSGINMIASSDLLAPSNTERKTLEIECESLTVSIERRIQRTVIRGGEGDDLLDEGAESAVYEAVAIIGTTEYKEVLGLFRGSSPMIEDPFGQGDLKVAFKSLSYDGETLRMTLIEDIE